MNTSTLTTESEATSPPVIGATSINIKSILKVLFELIIVLALVMAFFLFLLRLLNGLFPEGSGMQEIINQTGAAQIAARLHKDLLVKSDSGTSELAPNGSLVATLTEMNRDVRSKRADSITWKPTQMGMPLYNQDSVQTFSRSSTTIKFDEQNRLQLGPDTLVIIKRMEQDILFKDRRSSLVLVEGELSGSLGNNNKTERHVEIITAGASANIRTRDNIDETVKFKVSVNPDQSSTVAILQGSAEIISQGIKQKINTDQAVVIREGAAPSAPKPLPKAVKLNSPANNKASYYRDIPDRVDFSWSDSGANQYRLIISKDREQKIIVLDEKMEQPHFTHGNLTQGEYYWRVSGIDKEGSEGKAVSQRKLRIIQDSKPPALSVEFPDENISTNTFTIHGKSEPGTKIYINNQLVNSNRNTGEFNHQMTFTDGINVILVEAADHAGNISYLSQLINVDDQS